MGTSNQQTLGSPEYKRSESLHHSGVKDKVVDIDRDWKNKHSVPVECNPPRIETTSARIFVPASNVGRTNEEGVMRKIRVERAAKLEKEDKRGKSYNILTGALVENKVWLNTMGSQKEGFTL